MRWWLPWSVAFVLSLSWGAACHADDAACEQTEAIAAIESLGGKVKIDAANPEIPTCSVTFSEVMTDDGALVHLRKLPNVTELHLNCPNVTDVGLKSLAGMTDLKTLVLGGMRYDHFLPSDDWTPRLVPSQVTDAGLENLTAMSQLRELHLSGTQITDAGLKHLAGLTKLDTLYLDQTSITDTGLVHLAGLVELETLDLGKTGITNAGLEHLRPLRRLETLDLSGAKIEDEGVAHLCALPQLSCLVFDGAPLTDRGLETLSRMRQLDWLVLNRARITDAGLKHLAKLPRLKVLHLLGNPITDAGLKTLSEFRELKELVLETKGITDDGLVYLTRLAHLETLWLRGTNITDAQLDVFTRMPHLQNLGLENTEVTAEGHEDLQQAMPLCHVTWRASESVSAIGHSATASAVEEDSADYPEDDELDELQSGHVDTVRLMDILTKDENPLKRGLAALEIGQALSRRTWQSNDGQDLSDKLMKMLVAAAHDDKEESVRIAAVVALAQHDPFPWDLFGEFLAAPSPRVRVVAALRIGERYPKPEADDGSGDRIIGGEEADEEENEDTGPVGPPWLIRALRHEDSAVRGLAALATEKDSVDRKAALPILLAALQQEDTCPIHDLVRGDPPYIEEAALTYIGLIGPDAVEAVPILLDRVARPQPPTSLLGSGRSWVSPMAMVEALVGIGRPAVPELVEKVTTKYGPTRLVAAMALAGIGEHRDKAVPVLIRSLHGESTYYCRGGMPHRHDVAVLAACGHEAVPALLEATKSAEIGYHAYEALTGMQHDADAVVPLLANALSSPDVSIRRVAASVLGFLEEHAEPAIPALRRALKDPDETIAQNATVTLAAVRMRGFEGANAWGEPSRPFTDDDHLKLFAELVLLERLDLAETSITGSGLAYLRDFKRLRELRLPRTLRDVGLQHIGHLTTLETLYLENSHITDAGMAYLGGLTRLEELDLQETAITDVGLRYLAQMPRLAKLNVGYAASITDGGITHLRQCTRMRHLDLRGTEVTDACLVHIACMKDLEYLALSDHITDAGLAQLEGLCRLQHLSFGRSKVTKQALLRLKAALPSCSVWYMDGPNTERL